MSGGQCLEANSLINSTAWSRRPAEQRDRTATSAVAVSGVIPAASIKFRVWWIGESKLELLEAWDRRMWKVERSGEKEGRVLVIWLKNLMESEGVVASLA